MNSKVAGLVVVLALTMTVFAQDDEVTASEGETLFIEAASQNDIYEIASSRLAVQRAENQAVKNFAQEMIDAHTRTTVELLPLADELGVIPTSESTPAQGILIEHLRTLDGAAFDSAYLEQQVRAHEDSVNIFEISTSTVQDTPLKGFLNETLPVLEEHLREAQELAQTAAN